MIRVSLPWPKRRALFAALVLACGLVLAPPARAEDGASPQVLADQLKEAQKKKDADAMSGLLEQAVAAHNQADAAGKKLLQGAVGAILKDKHSGAARAVAATTLGQFEDAEGAFKQLKGVLPGPKDENTEPHQVEAFKAVGALKPPSAVAVLLKLVDKCKSLPARQGAIEALAGYGQDKKQRVKILEALVETMVRAYESELSAQQNPKGAKGSEVWQALGTPLLESLNKLTGRSEKDAPAWVALWKEHKKKPAGLFPSGD